MPKQLELAAKYLEAADRYRDMLDAGRADDARRLSERAGQGEGRGGGVGRAAVASRPAAPPAQPHRSRRRPRPQTVSECAVRIGGAGAAVRPGRARTRSAPSVDLRQRARWLLHEAREKLHQGTTTRPSARRTRRRP